MSKSPTQKEQVIAAALKAGNPVTIKQLRDLTGLKRKPVYDTLYYLVKDGKATKDEETGEFWLDNDEVEVDDLEKGGGKVQQEQAKAETSEGVLDQRGLFSKNLTSVGVRKDVVPTITDMFFSGDINDLEWLKQVLHKQAAGFVSAHQENTVLYWWANTMQLKLPDELLAKPVSKDPEVKKTSEKTEVTSEPSMSAGILDPGMGWDVKKDESGDWVAVPGGPIQSYKEAMDRAERRQMMNTWRSQSKSSGPSGTTGDEGGQSKTNDFFMMFAEKMMERMFDSSSKGDSEAVAKIEALQSKVYELTEAAHTKEIQELKQMVSALYNRDPLDDINRANEFKAALGVQDHIITDQSPAVQLIKDATDKFDRGTERFLGVMERFILKSDEFNPEQTRTPAEREAAAENILQQLEGGEKIRASRSNTFGI